MLRKLQFFVNRLNERLWVKPAMTCLVSMAVAFVTRYADRLSIEGTIPEISLDSVESLLKVLASSMLVIASLAVASMVSSYNSASTTATPRSFPLIVSDDLSQFALSTFVGAFIFSVVTLIAVQNSYYGEVALFAVFLVTLGVFAAVILTFMRWVDGIARLGLLGNTVKKVEKATETALCKRLADPLMGGIAVESMEGFHVFANKVGYVQLIDMEALQDVAESAGFRITILSSAGRMILPDRVLAAVRLMDDAGVVAEVSALEDGVEERIRKAFIIGEGRTFDEDPRFGLVALSQIASRAMSPAINDPGTVIDILGTYARLIGIWCQPADASDDTAIDRKVCYPNVAVPALQLDDIFEDAFAAIGRDGAGNVEVAVRLQTVLASLASVYSAEVAEAARKQARIALDRAEVALQIEHDLKAVREASIVQ